jgi:hypothetical protein
MLRHSKDRILVLSNLKLYLIGIEESGDTYQLFLSEQYPKISLDLLCGYRHGFEKAKLLT